LDGEAISVVEHVPSCPLRYGKGQRVATGSSP
jgi:hypothetical protein